MHRRVAWPLILVLTMVSCGSPTEERSNGPDDTPEAATAPCELEGYPCTFADVPTEVTERSLSLAAQTLERVGTDGGGTALAWLAAQPQVIEAYVADETIWLRLEGGRPVYAVDHGSVVVTAGATAAAGASVTPQHVTGRDRDRDGAVNNRDERYALVLSPLSSSYGSMEGDTVEVTLDAWPDYENRVTHLVGNDADRAAFANIRAFDVVHVVTDARRRCAPGGKADTCRTYLALGEIADPASVLVGDDLDEPGLVYGVHRTDGEARYHLAASDIWFAHALPDEQAQNLVFLSVGTGDSYERFRSSIMGPTAGSVRNVMLAWDAAIDRSDPTIAADYAAAMRDVYAHATTNGMTTGEAMAMAGVPGVSEVGIRIREVVTLLNPETEEPLVDGERYTRWLRGELDDAERDDIGVGLLIEGMPEGVDPPFTVTLDGKPATVVSSERASEGPYWFVEAARLRVDPLESGRTYELEAIIELPEGGESRYVTDVTFPLWQMTISGSEHGGHYTGQVAVASWLSEGQPVTLSFASEEDVDFEQPQVYALLTTEELADFAPGTFTLNENSPGTIVVANEPTSVEWRVGNGTNTAMVGCNLETWTEPPLPSVTFDSVSETQARGFIEGSVYRMETIDCTDPNGQRFPGVSPELASLSVEFTASR